MSQIINGLSIDISAEELKGILTSRIGYYNSKAEKYQKHVAVLEKNNAKLNELDEELAAEAEDIGKYANSMVTKNDTASWKLKVLTAKNQANYFKFMAEHVVTGATYRLDNTALQLIGVMDRGW